jgi:hypothetical protein
MRTRIEFPYPYSVLDLFVNSVFIIMIYIIAWQFHLNNTIFVRNKLSLEDDTHRSQFHQHYKRGFCANIFALKSRNLKSNNKKVTKKPLVKSTKVSKYKIKLQILFKKKIPYLSQGW